MLKIINKIFNLINSPSRWELKLIELKKNRANIGRDTIIQNFVSSGLDSEFSIIVIDFVLDYIPVKDFPIQIGDDLIDEYEIDAEDLGDFFEKTLKEKFIEIPSRKDQDLFLKDNNSYPIELAIKFLTWCRDKNCYSTGN